MNTYFLTRFSLSSPLISYLLGLEVATELIRNAIIDGRQRAAIEAECDAACFADDEGDEGDDSPSQSQNSSLFGAGADDDDDDSVDKLFGGNGSSVKKRKRAAASTAAAPTERKTRAVKVKHVHQIGADLLADYGG
jgi:hypothetical protein